MSPLPALHRLKHCLNCRRQFVANRPDSGYCTRACRNRLQHVRKRDAGKRQPWVARDHLQHCEACGGQWQNTKSRPTRSCSRRCWNFLQTGEWPTSLVPEQHPIRSSRVPPDHPSRRRPRTRFVAHDCQHCGAHFITDKLACFPGVDRFCTRRCSRGHHRQIRRARERQLPYEMISRFAVFERDGWTCQLCGDPLDRTAAPCDPLSPTLDHILPLALGGHHVTDNVQAAHFSCNSLKGARPCLDPRGAAVAA